MEFWKEKIITLSLIMEYTALVMTHVDKDTNRILKPHHDFLVKNNPGIDVLYVLGKDSGYGKIYDWKNSWTSIQNKYS